MKQIIKKDKLSKFFFSSSSTNTKINDNKNLPIKLLKLASIGLIRKFVDKNNFILEYNNNNSNGNVNPTS